jgi:hypothetical protein
MLGTPQYMSPEQILGRPIDARSDLYSVGVVFFELLTGRCPFAGNFAAVLEQHVTLPPPELPTALAAQEPRMAEVLRSLLSKEPDQRFRTAKELAAALEETSPKGGAMSQVRATSQGHAPAAFFRKVGRSLGNFGRRAPASLAKVGSSMSAAASSGVSSIRDYAKRLQRRRRARILARESERRVTRAVVAARQLGQQTVKSGHKWLASVRAVCAKAVEYGRTQWRLRGRALMLVGCYVAAVGLIVLLVVVLLRRPSAVHPEGAARTDHEGTRRTDRSVIGEARPTGTTPASKSRASTAASSPSVSPTAGESGNTKSRR